LDIVQVARRLFSQHGYHRTGLSDIQSVTGLTKGAFYHHFRSKEDLALGVLDMARAEYAERWIGPTQTLAKPGQRLAALFDGVLALNAQPDWCNCQLMATLCAEMTDADVRLKSAVWEMQLKLFELWRDLITQAQRAGEVDERVDAATWAQWINNTLLGALVSRKLGSALVPTESSIELIKTLLLRPATHR